MNTQHTSAPWIKEGATILQDNTKKGICKLIGSEENQNANAKLISAAPEMFEALQAVSDYFSGQDSLLASQVNSALTKAKGENGLVPAVPEMLETLQDFCANLTLRDSILESKFNAVINQ